MSSPIAPSDGPFTSVLFIVSITSFLASFISSIVPFGKSITFHGIIPFMWLLGGDAIPEPWRANFIHLQALFALLDVSTSIPQFFAIIHEGHKKKRLLSARRARDSQIELARFGPDINWSIVFPTFVSSLLFSVFSIVYIGPVLVSTTSKTHVYTRISIGLLIILYSIWRVGCELRFFRVVQRSNLMIPGSTTYWVITTLFPTRLLGSDDSSQPNSILLLIISSIAGSLSGMMRGTIGVFEPPLLMASHILGLSTDQSRATYLVANGLLSPFPALYLLFSHETWNITFGFEYFLLIGFGLMGIFTGFAFYHHLTIPIINHMTILISFLGGFAILMADHKSPILSTTTIVLLIVSLLLYGLISLWNTVPVNEDIEQGDIKGLESQQSHSSLELQVGEWRASDSEKQTEPQKADEIDTEEYLNAIHEIQTNHREEEDIEVDATGCALEDPLMNCELDHPVELPGAETYHQHPTDQFGNSYPFNMEMLLRLYQQGHEQNEEEGQDSEFSYVPTRPIDIPVRNENDTELYNPYLKYLTRDLQG